MKGGTTMRRLIIFAGVAAAASIAIAAAFARSGDANPAATARASAGDDTARVASALGLSAAQQAVLAKAQALGREATACLLANGATQTTGGAITDTSGEATEACAAAIEANEAFLSSAEFTALLKAAQPRFEAAARCFSRVSGIPRGTIIEPRDLTPDLQRRIEVAQTECYRPDGLPR